MSALHSAFLVLFALEEVFSYAHSIGNRGDSPFNVLRLGPTEDAFDQRRLDVPQIPLPPGMPTPPDFPQPPIPIPTGRRRRSPLWMLPSNAPFAKPFDRFTAQNEVYGEPVGTQIERRGRTRRGSPEEMMGDMKGKAMEKANEAKEKGEEMKEKGSETMDKMPPPPQVAQGNRKKHPKKGNN